MKTTTLGLLFSFFLGLGVGMLYERQIMVTQLAQERARSARLHYQDWHRFMQHVRDDIKIAGAARFQFPSMTSRSFWKFAANVEKSTLVEHQKGPSNYSLTAVFENMTDNAERFCPSNVKIVDGNSELYDPYTAFPSIACVVIPGRATSARYRFFFHVSTGATPSKLILIGSNGYSQFSLGPDLNPIYDPLLRFYDP